MESEFEKFIESAKKFWERYSDLKGIIGFSSSMMSAIERHPEIEDKIILDALEKQMLTNQLSSMNVKDTIKKLKKIKKNNLKKNNQKGL